MANTFKQINFAAEPASAGTPYTMYTVASSTTTIIIGLILTNISYDCCNNRNRTCIYNCK